MSQKKIKQSNMSVLRIFTRLALIFCISHATAAEPKKLLPRVVTTKYGSLKGYLTTLPNKQWRPVEIYLGVPYASPPIGSLRFMPPVTPAQWTGVRSADRFSAVCPQKFPDVRNETEALKSMPAGRLEYLRRLIPLLQNQSEDCLYLNIYAPTFSKFLYFDIIPNTIFAQAMGDSCLSKFNLVLLN